MNIKTNGIVYNPLGGASYIFENDIIGYILDYYQEKDIMISIGAQPNSSPHLGTMVTSTLAFCLAQRMKTKDRKRRVEVLFEYIETAPAKTIMIKGSVYQISLSYSGIINEYIRDYNGLLSCLSEITEVPFFTRKQVNFNSIPETKAAVKKVIDNRQYLGKRLDHKYGRLRMRVACPICGLTDKNCDNNLIDTVNKTISCYCPYHGIHKTNYSLDISQLEYNTPLRNLIRALSYSKINEGDNKYKIMRVTGADYAGFYQEEMLYRTVAHIGVDIEKLPVIFYSPLVTDWSGAKLSKSLYFKEDAYNDLPKELLNYSAFIDKYGFKGIEQLIHIVNDWIDNPYKLFRNYSIYYFIKEFESLRI